MSDKTRLWLITGASRGFGRAIAECALQAGDRVILSVRTPAAVADLVAAYPHRAHVLTLDVAKSSDIAPAIADAERRFGDIDVLMNNAGYVVIGAVEEVDPATYRALYETNFFGAVEVLRSVVSLMRRRRTGHILTMSAMGGLVPAAGLAYYCSTKAALESITEALAHEVGPLGIKVTIVQPGNFRTSVLESRVEAPEIKDYETTAAGALRRRFAGSIGKQPGDPVRAARAIYEVVGKPEPPLRLTLGSDAIERIGAQLDRLRHELDKTSTAARDMAFES